MPHPVKKQGGGRTADTVATTLQEALRKIDDSLARDPFDANYTFDLILQTALQLIGAKFGQLLTVRGVYLEIRATTGTEEIRTRVRIDDSFCGCFVVKPKKWAIANDVRKPPWNEKYKQYLGEEMRSELAVPVVSGDEVIAVLNVESPHIAAFEESHAEVLSMLAGQTAVALRIASEHELDRELVEIEQAFAEALMSPEKLMRLILDRGLELIGALFGQLLAVSGDDLAIHATTGHEKTGTRVPINDCFCGCFVVKPKKWAIANDVRKPPWNEKYKQYLGEMRSEIAVPLMVAGHVVGVLNMESPEVAFFTERHARILSRLAPLAAIALRQATVNKDLQRARHRMKGWVNISDHAIKAISADIEHRVPPDPYDVRTLQDAFEGLRKTIARLSPKLNLLPTMVNDVLDDVLSKYPFPSNLEVVHNSGKNELPLVIADHDDLQEVFTLIIENAVEAMRQKENPCLTVDVRHVVETNDVEVDITDNGTGIAPEHLTLIFEPFFTTKGEKGTGSGLAFCRLTLDAMLGDIKVETKVGIGTCFTIVLRGISGFAVTRGIGTIIKEAPMLSILIADRNDQWSAFAKDALEEAGHRVTTLSDFDTTDEELCAWLRDHDLIMVDLVRRKRDGYQLMHRLKQIVKAQAESEPVKKTTAAVTTAPSDDDALKAASFGVYCYQDKPDKREELLELLARARAESWMGRLAETE